MHRYLNTKTRFTMQNLKTLFIIFILMSCHQVGYLQSAPKGPPIYFTMQAQILELGSNSNGHSYYLNLTFPGLSPSEMNNLTSLNMTFSVTASSNESGVNTSLAFSDCNNAAIPPGTAVNTSSGNNCQINIFVSNPQAALQYNNGLYSLSFSNGGGNSNSFQSTGCPITVVDIDGSAVPNAYCIDIDMNYCGGTFNGNSNLVFNNSNGGQFTFCYGGNNSFTGKETPAFAGNTQQSVAIFPNPASTDLTLQFDTFQEKTNVYISTLDGKTVYNNSVLQAQSIQIPVNHLDAGIYWVSMQDHQGVVTKKLVIQ